MAFDDIWDDDSLWTGTENRDASTQADKYDLNSFFADMKLSPGAGTLSKKIAKMQQRRAQKLQKLTSVEEEEKSQSLTPPIFGSQENMGSALSSPSVGKENLTFSGMATSLRESTNGMTSTPRFGARTPEPRFEFLSPIAVQKPREEFESEDEFEDAQDHFEEDVLEKISMSASFSTIEALLSRDVGEDNGQSCIRAPMTQSLMEVEEDLRPEITPPRNTRSSSVSPRPMISTPLTTKTTVPAPTKASTVPKAPVDKPRMSARNGMERRSLGAAQSILRGSRSQSRSAPGSVGFSLTLPSLNGRPSRSPRSAVKTTLPKPVVESARTSYGSPSSFNDSSLSVRNALTLHSDLATLDDITRRQEEMLRQEVLQQQQAERKNSWQGEGSLSSPNSSVGSLASSHSVDIGSLKKTLPTPSRLRAPSKLPRPSGLATPSPRVSSVAGIRRAPLEKSRNTADDECF